MRIVAGRFRGRLLESPPGRTTRPITDRAKETLFNILGHRFGTLGELPDVPVLDVFSGTGSLGLEALSRGARSCTFVERDRHAVHCLRVNIERLGLGDVTTVLTENAWTLRPPQPPGGFGLIFVDPPYEAGARALKVADLLERLAPSFARAGLLVFRHETRAEPLSEAHLRTLRIVDCRAIGRMRLLLLQSVTT